ncbi:MAG: tRNA (guanosine(37)-N1)-methyltransferase TrmD [Armatimonadetes bacterium]|nr:tRNA (guanosine(37)-N1)-methyltransferase TrmD [Armatimonadota bacterium]
MRIDVITTFPEVIEAGAGFSIVKRAREKGVLDLMVHNLRDYARDRHRSTDDEPFGPGAGMVMKPEPVFDAVETIRRESGSVRSKVLLMTPQGETFSQSIASELACEDHLIIICGHYEGVDERIREHLVDREISIGDYVLTGGELPSLVVLDAVTRLLPGALGAEESALEESFAEGLLEYPHYTRPAEFRGWRVPDVLLSGHHAEIARWRRVQSLKRTYERRPDLLSQAKLTDEDRVILCRVMQEQETEEDNNERD